MSLARLTLQAEGRPAVPLATFGDTTGILEPGRYTFSGDTNTRSYAGGGFFGPYDKTYSFTDTRLTVVPEPVRHLAPGAAVTAPLPTDPAQSEALVEPHPSRARKTDPCGAWRSTGSPDGTTARPPARPDSRVRDCPDGPRLISFGASSLPSGTVLELAAFHVRKGEYASSARGVGRSSSVAAAPPRGRSGTPQPLEPRMLLIGPAADRFAARLVFDPGARRPLRHQLSRRGALRRARRATARPVARWPQRPERTGRDARRRARSTSPIPATTRPTSPACGR